MNTITGGMFALILMCAIVTMGIALVIWAILYKLFFRSILRKFYLHLFPDEKEIVDSMYRVNAKGKLEKI